MGDSAIGIIKYNGNFWETFSTEVGGYAIFGFTTSDIWLVGGSIFHFDGQQWNEILFDDLIPFHGAVDKRVLLDCLHHRIYEIGGIGELEPFPALERGLVRGTMPDNLRHVHLMYGCDMRRGLDAVYHMVRHPLQPFDARYFDAADPALFSFGPEFAGMRREAREPAPAVAFVGAATTAPAEAPAPATLDLRELLAYFKDPAKQLLAHGLNLRLDAVDADHLRDSEPLEARVEAIDRVARRLFFDAVGQADAALPDAPPDWLRLTGMLPPGRVGLEAYAKERDTALELVAAFQKYFDVALGLNEKESVEVGNNLGLDTSDHSPEGLTKLCQAIHQKVRVDTVIVHPTAYALASGLDGCTLVQGPFTPKPKITTGAGDHFNSGFCLGKLLGFSTERCLLTGVTTSGFYVRTGQSPAVADLAQMLRNWPS